MKNAETKDFSKFIDSPEKSRKEKLIEECRKQDVSIYIDDATETSKTIYAEMRAVASEAELERRLNSKRSVNIANRSSIVSAIALFVSIVALIKSFIS